MMSERDVQALVTVIVPTYRRPAMLCRALDSIYQSTYPHLEVIVIDDDNDPSIEQLVTSAGYEDIHYLQGYHAGGAGARNIGIRHASGDYVTFLDDDDLFLPEKIEKQVAIIRALGTTVVLCGSRLSTGERIDVLPVSHDIKKALQTGNPYHITLLADAKIIKQLEFDPALPNGQDWDLLVRLYKVGEKFSYIAEDLVIRDDGGHARITNANREQKPNTSDRLTALNMHKEWLGLDSYRYLCAKLELAYVRDRPDHRKMILRAIKVYGPRAVMRVFIGRVLKHVNKKRHHKIE